MDKINSFFNKQKNQSNIKSKIVVEYFKTWAAILLKGQKKRFVNSLLYIDLYSGPGYYNDKIPSTPILILESIVNDQIFNECVKTFFNDKEIKFSNELKRNIQSLPYYGELLTKPKFLNASTDMSLLTDLINSNPNTPSFTFLDPLGYKGISAELCRKALIEWGSDLFLFFNLNRIRAALKNPTVVHLMKDLFGSKYEMISNNYNNLRGKKGELFIINSFENIFNEKNYYTVDLRINFKEKNLTSHYFLFVSKSKLGYMKMKEIFAKYSTRTNEGIPNFELINKGFELDLFPKHSISKMAFDIYSLRELFNGLTVESIYEYHNINKPFIKENYKNAIDSLKKNDQIILIDKKGKETDRVTYTAKVIFK